MTTETTPQATPHPVGGQTIGDDAAATTALIAELAKEFRVKPELVFKVVELSVNYRLASASLRPPLPMPTVVPTDADDQDSGVTLEGQTNEENNPRD